MAYVLDVFMIYLLLMVKACLYTVAFVFFLLFVFGTWQIAKDYTIAVTLLVGMIFAFLVIASGTNPSSMADSQTWIRLGDGKIAGIILLVGATAVVSYKGFWIYQRQQDLAAATASKSFPVSSNNPQYRSPTSSTPTSSSSGPSCHQLGVMYGRASVKGMRGEHVNVSDDVEIPSRCQNQASTSAGIRAGIESESRR
jgi:hypothetical protein